MPTTFNPKMSAADKVTFWVGKLFFFTIMIALPLLVFPWWQVLIGFIIVMLTIGLVLGVIFPTRPHQRRSRLPGAGGDPAAHRQRVGRGTRSRRTVDFAPHNRLLSLYIGGLNYQVEQPLAAAHLPPELPASRADRGVRRARSSVFATTAIPRGARRSPPTGEKLRLLARRS